MVESRCGIFLQGQIIRPLRNLGQRGGRAMSLSRVRLSVKQLVCYELGPTRLTPTAIETALAQVQRRGYVASFAPLPEAYNQHIILLLASHPFAAVYRALALDGSPT